MKNIILIPLVLLTGSSAKTVTRLWKSTDPTPPVQPKECQSQRDEQSIYDYVAGGKVRPDSSFFGYEFSSFKHQTVLSQTGGYVNGPLSMITWTNFTAPNDPKAGLQLQVSSATCQYWNVEGGAPYPGYDYYTNLVLSMSAAGSYVYFTVTDSDPIYGNLTSWTIPFPNADGIVNYTVSYTSNNWLVYYIAQGYQYCCAEACPGRDQSCRDGSTSAYAETFTQVHTYNYVVYPDNHTWPVGMLQKPTCPYDIQFCGINPCPASPKIPDSKSDLEYTQDEYNSLAVALALSLGLALIFSWGYIYIKILPRNKHMSREDLEVGKNSSS